MENQFGGEHVDKRHRSLGRDTSASGSSCCQPQKNYARNEKQEVFAPWRCFDLLRLALAGSILALTGVRVQPYSYIMRYSLQHKAQNHENILSVAARSFRERGGDSSGIGTVMKKVGMKKGGF